MGEPEAGMFWFPVNEHPSDKARMCTEITVPKGLRAVSTGLAGAGVQSRDTVGRPSGGARATRWPRTCRRWRSAPGASTGPGPSSGIPVLNYVDRTLSRSVDRSLGRTAEIVDFFETRFGDYPFESAGGIADNHVSYYALENQTRPTYDKKTVAWRGLTGTVAHEIAHQWYGDSVALERWRDIWLNEGFATYGEWLWKEHDGGATVEQSFDEVYSHPGPTSRSGR